jgi:hypothetical protein
VCRDLALAVLNIMVSGEYQKEDDIGKKMYEAVQEVNSPSQQWVYYSP